MRNNRATRALAIFILALLVRFVPMGALIKMDAPMRRGYITPDELIWVMRSVRFADAVAARDWAAIPQTGHPGLTTMALGALGVRITAILYPAQSAQHLAWIRHLAWLAPENAEAFDHLAFFLPASRGLVALVASLSLTVAYLLAGHALGERVAQWLALCLSLDPFLSGLSGLLHTDALQATFILLAVLFITHPTPSPRFALPLSALCLALAGLTKTLGLLAAPGIAFAILLNTQLTWKKRLWHVATLTNLTLIFLLGLYPPFWSTPVAAITSLMGAISYHEGIGNRDVFFMGRTVTDPGALFYPLVLCFRLTPLVMLGLLKPLPRMKKAPFSKRGYIWFPILTYLIPLTFASKKFDRYILTLIPLLTLLASFNWATKFAPHRFQWTVKSTSLALLLVPWALVAPYPLLYANPLLGGPWLAQHVIPLGWGEAAGLATTHAARIAPEAHTLLSADVPGSAPFFAGTVWPRSADRAACADIILGDVPTLPAAHITQTDLTYAGLHLTTLATLSYTWPDTPMLLPGPLPGAMSALMPDTDTLATLAAWANHTLPPNQPFLWIHAPTCYPLTNAQLITLFQANHQAVVCQPPTTIAGFAAAQCTRIGPLNPALFHARFGTTLDVLAEVLPAQAQAPTPLTIRFRWLPHALVDALDFHLALWDETGVRYATGSNRLIDKRGWPTAAWSPHAIADAETYLPLPLHLPPGTYSLTLSLTDSAGRHLGVTLPDGAFAGVRYPLGTVDIQPPPYPAPELNLLQPLDVDLPGLHLVGVTPPPTEVWAGDQLPFSLGWERFSGPLPGTLRWSLLCAGQASDTGLLSSAAFVQWHTGHRHITHHTPRTNPHLPTATCTLHLVVEETTIPLGDIHMQARERRFELPHPPHTPLAIAVGAFADIMGVDTPTTPIQAGTAITMTTYWQAKSAADLDYTVFVHLADTTGSNWAQSDAWPESGHAPTSSWVEGQIIWDTHTLALPPDMPAGTYRLFVGLYDAGSGGRVPLTQQNGTRLPDNRAPVGTLIVEAPH